MENLRSERILNGIENMDPSLNQSLWSIHGRVGSAYSSNESLVSQRASLGEHLPLTSTSSADSTSTLLKVGSKFKSMGSVDFTQTRTFCRRNGQNLERTTSMDRPRSLCEVGSESGVLGNTPVHLLLSEDTGDNDSLNSKLGQLDTPLTRRMESFCKFPYSDDSGTDGSDSNLDDCWSGRHRRLSDKGLERSRNFRKSTSDAQDCRFSNGGSLVDPTRPNYESRPNFLNSSFPGCSHPLISILSRSPSPECPKENSSTVLTNGAGNPTVDMLKVLGTQEDTAEKPKLATLKGMGELTVPEDMAAIKAKRHSVGSLMEPELQHFLPLSFNTLSSPRRATQLGTPHNKSSITGSNLLKLRSRSESCLLSSLNSSHFDVVYLKDSNYTKPKVATVKEEEEVLTHSGAFIKDESTSDQRALEDSILKLSDSTSEEMDTPPKSATKSKVMFSELTEVCSFVEEGESEVDSKPNSPNKRRAWEPDDPPSESPSESFQMDTRESRAKVYDELRAETSDGETSWRESSIELQDIEVQLEISDPPDHGRSESTEANCSDTSSVSKQPSDTKPPEATGSLSSKLNETGHTSPKVNGNLSNNTEHLSSKSNSTGHLSPKLNTRHAGPLANLPPIRRATRFTQQRSKRQPVKPVTSVRELSQMFEAPSAELVPPLRPVASVRHSVLANGSEATKGKSPIKQITGTKPESKLSPDKRALQVPLRKESVSSSKIPTPSNPWRVEQKSRITTTNGITAETTKSRPPPKQMKSPHDGRRLPPPSPSAKPSTLKQQSLFAIPENGGAKSAAKEDRIPRGHGQQRSKQTPSTKPKPTKAMSPRTRVHVAKQNGHTPSKEPSMPKAAFCSADGVKDNANGNNNNNTTDFSEAAIPRVEVPPLSLSSTDSSPCQSQSCSTVGSPSRSQQSSEVKTIFRPKRRYSGNEFEQCSSSLHRNMLKQHYSFADIDSVLRNSRSTTSESATHNHTPILRSTSKWLNFGASSSHKGTSKNSDQLKKMNKQKKSTT